MAVSAKKGGSKPDAVSSQDDRTTKVTAGPVTLTRDIQSQIGDKLRSMYGELIEQPVPDRLAELLKKLG